MRLHKLIVTAAWFCGAAVVFGQTPAAMAPITKNDVVLVCAPHPDDETLGCAGVIQSAVAAGARVYVVFLTNGDHNQVAFKIYEKKLILTPAAYIRLGELRRKEATEATGLLGVKKENLIFLGYPDYGTLKIWKEVWGDEPAYTNLLTRARTVPYAENYSYGAPYKGESILGDIKTILLKVRPTRIFVSHPADTNFDHRAFYNFLTVALADLAAILQPPKVYPYLVHCGAWPAPNNFHPEAALTPPPSLLSDPQIAWQSQDLTLRQEMTKSSALKRYRSQRTDRGGWMNGFVKKNELFGDYAPLDLRPAGAAGGTDMTGVGEGDAGGATTSKIARYTLVRENDLLTVRLRFDGALEKEAGFLLFLFGYCGRTPFAGMPKLSFQFIPPDHVVVRNGVKRLPMRVDVHCEDNNIVRLEIPFSLLADPDCIFTAVESYVGEIPIDLTAWRTIKVQ